MIGNQSVLTGDGYTESGSYVTGLENTTWDMTNPDIVSGRAATEDQLKSVSDAIIDGTGKDAIGGFGLTDDSGTAVKQDWVRPSKSPATVILRPLPMLMVKNSP